MGVVEIERMTERAVQQRRYRRGPALVVAEHCRFTGRIERQRLQHLQDRRRRFGFAPGADRAAEEVQRQQLGARQNVLRNVGELQRGDVACERGGFVGHLGSLFCAAR